MLDLVTLDLYTLPTYVLVALPGWKKVPAHAMLPLFFVSSIDHFSSDIGLANSSVLHASFAVFWALGHVQWAWSVFTLYYCGLHVPCAYASAVAALRDRCRVFAACACAVTSLLWWAKTARLSTSDVDRVRHRMTSARAMCLVMVHAALHLGARRYV